MLICLDQRSGSGCGSENPNTTLFCRKCGKSLRFAMRLLDPDSVLKHYRIVRIIGRGAAGAVYEAEVIRHPQVYVAIKECLPSHASDSVRAVFADLRRLRHDHLPRYYEVFEAQEAIYLVMELIGGTSLAEHLARQTAPLLENHVLNYTLQLCDVLSYLHTHEVTGMPARTRLLHRDIKPANIRLAPERHVKLVDIGLPRPALETMRTVRRGLTSVYAPPEQFTGAISHADEQRDDPRSDLYSLGATLYHLLTGQKPPLASMRQASSNDPLIPPRQLNPRLSPHMNRVITRALQLRPEQRFPDLDALKRALLTGTRPLTLELEGGNR